MLKIGIDVDNVIADSAKVLISEINKFYNTKLTYSDIRMYDFHTILGISKTEMRPYWEKIYSERVPMRCKLVRGAREGVKGLKKKYEVYLVTSRFREYEKDTVEWLRRMKIPYDHIAHVEEKQKHVYAEKKGIKIFIEDDLEQAIYMSEAGIKVFLFDHPWNRNVDVKKRFVRVKGWSEILKHL